jgi:hypothetical protein
MSVAGKKNRGTASRCRPRAEIARQQTYCAIA